MLVTATIQAFDLAFQHRELSNGPEVYRSYDSLAQTLAFLAFRVGNVSTFGAALWK